MLNKTSDPIFRLVFTITHVKLENNFPLTCTGIPEIVAAYQNCIRQVQLYGPTNVSPIVNHVIRFAEQAAKESTASVCTMQCQWSLPNLS